MSEALELDDIQGLVARGYGGLPEASFVLLEIADAAQARGWLGGLAGRVTAWCRDAAAAAERMSTPSQAHSLP